MHKSSRREPDKAVRSPGHRLKLVAVLTLAAVSALGYIAFEPAHLWPGELVRKLSRADCNQDHSSDADRAPACPSATASRDIQRVTDSPKLMRTHFLQTTVSKIMRTIFSKAATPMNLARGLTVNRILMAYAPDTRMMPRDPQNNY